MHVPKSVGAAPKQFLSAPSAKQGLDALRAGLGTTVLSDGIRGVDVQPGDSQRALDELLAAGAKFSESVSLP